MKRDIKYLPPIVGFTGKAGVGKDTLAAFLCETYGYRRYSLADPIKWILNERFGWTMEDWNDRHWKERPSIEWGGCDRREGGHITFSPRSWAQWLGTEVGRALAGPDVWVHALKARAAADGAARIVIPDVRFDNEALAVGNSGGVCIQINRTVDTVRDHISEAGVSAEHTYACIGNTGTIEAAHEQVRAVLAEWSEMVGSSRA